jgi:diaminopimelate epimerase
MAMDFSKLHGLGNDFIVVDELHGISVQENDKPGFAKRFCRRKVSVGADGVLFLQESKNHDFRMRMFNPDGSEAETCVNGLRCAGFKYFKISGKRDMSVETLAGPVKIKVAGKAGETAMVELEVIGKKEWMGESEIKLKNESFQYHFVNVGNPHVVIFLQEKVDGFPVKEIGPEIEEHDRFKPGRTNVEFVNVLDKTRLRMRVCERGAGETMSCGSGSIAAVIAACEAGLCEKKEWISVEQPGGTLEIKYGEAGEALLLKGPAEISFEGKLIN